jgi:hypothetical protein
LRRRSLAPEPRDHRLLVGGERARDHLERDELVQHLVVGEVHRAHAALAEQALHAVSLRQYLAGLERRARRRLGAVCSRRAIERIGRRGRGLHLRLAGVGARRGAARLRLGRRDLHRPWACGRENQ